MNKRSNYISSWMRVIFLLLIDQLSKHYFFSNNLNTGISFGWLINFSLVFWLVITAFVFILIWLIKTPSKTTYGQWARELFIAGAVSNLIDRFLFAGVRDWLQLPFWSVSNNLADIWISLGVLGIIAEKSFSARKHQTK